MMQLDATIGDRAQWSAFTEASRLTILSTVLCSYILILLSIFILSLFYLYSTFNIHVLTIVSDNLRCICKNQNVLNIEYIPI